MVNNAWTAQSVEYRYADVVIQTALRDGRPTETDKVWRAEGELLANDEPIGRLALSVDAISIKANLILSDHQIELQSWQWY